MTPRVSVIMPVYNVEKYAQEAIESILGQTYGDFELIIVNDGSVDGTAELIEAVSKADSRIRVLHQDNRGVSRSFNRGLELASGEYIARMDGDDVSFPDRLGLQVAHLDANTECVAVSGGVLIVDEEGDPVSISQPVARHAAIVDRLLGKVRGTEGTIFVNPCAMARGSIIREIGGCRAEYEPTDDRDLWLRMSERGQLFNLQSVLLKYRINERGISRARTLEQRRQSIRAVVDAYKRRGEDAPSTLEYPSVDTDVSIGTAARHLRTGKWAAANGYWGTAWKHFRRSWRKEPMNLDVYRAIIRLCGASVFQRPRFKRE